MDKIPDASGHLYKHLMVLGTFLALAAVYGFTVTVKAHDDKLEEAVKVLFVDDLPAAQRQWWQRGMEIRRQNVMFTSCVLGVAFLVGLVTAVAGGYFWYVRVQKLEDDSRRLENQKLRAALEGKPKGVEPA